MELIESFIIFMKNFHIELLIVEWMFCSVLRKRLHPAGILLLAAAFVIIPYSILYGTLGRLFHVGADAGFGLSSIGFMATVLFSMLLMWLFFQFSSIKQLLFYVIAAIIVQHLGFCITNAAFLLFRVQTIAGQAWIELLCCMVTYILCYFIFVRRLRENVDGLRNSDIIVFTLFSYFLVYILSVWFTKNGTQVIECYVFDGFCCVLLLLLHVGMFERSQLEEQQEIMQRMIQVEKENHVITKETIEIINMKCHDIKYQVEALKHSPSSEVRQEYIDELEKSIKIYDMSARTGNDTLDVLIQEKSLLWDTHHIQFTCISDGSKLDFMLPSDIYVIFGNALDNAMEEVRDIKDLEKRVISFNLNAKGNYVVASITNYYEKKIVFRNGLPETSKEDKDYHGYGLKSIRYLVEKYGGSISVTTERDIFKLNLLIPVKKKQLA